MVSFGFNVKSLFPRPIMKISSSLVPESFVGDKTETWQESIKWAKIIDCMGLLSAAAQKLQSPVTTADKIRGAENQNIYILSINGVVIGFIKVGLRDLYLIDEDWCNRPLKNCCCIFDFFVHHKQQRRGYGRQLYDAMLRGEHWTPVKCAIDRPSVLMLNFLKKNYGLTKNIPQTNNFVIYQGFFNDESSTMAKKRRTMHNKDDLTVEDDTKKIKRKLNVSNSERPIIQIAPFGRYGAPHPQSTMREIMFGGCEACRNP